MGGTRAAARRSGVLTVLLAPLTADDLDDARALAVLAEVAVGGAEQWARDLRHTSTMLLGAWEDDRLVGVATGVVAVDDADVHVVVVHPDHRRRGIGRALTIALCRAFVAVGAERVLLEVRAGNAAALAMYTALGFVEVARRGSYYGDGDDALVLALDAAAVPRTVTGDPRS